VGASTWHVYIVRCRTGELYTGVTVDLDRRIGEHNRGVAAKFTSSRRPVTLVYHEVCRDRSAALRREHQIKRMSRAEKVALTAG
jgi:putative endonuclease